MSHRTITRLLLVLAVTASGWLVTGVSVAHATRAPEPGEGTITPTPVIDPTGTPILQFVLVAALACLLSVAATLAIEALVRRSHRADGLVHL